MTYHFEQEHVSITESVQSRQGGMSIHVMQLLLINEHQSARVLMTVLAVLGRDVSVNERNVEVDSLRFEGILRDLLVRSLVIAVS